MMTMTKVWRLSPERAAGQLQEAADLLRSGGLVAFPTETVYGLGADAGSTAAVERIFAAKGRPSDNPLIVHLADTARLGELVRPYPALAARLMEKLWPGPLTIVLPALPDALSPLVTAGLPTVGIRVPAHPSALELLRRAGCPVAAPSANRSGRPSPTTARHVLDDLDGRIDGIVDDGPAGVGLESTVVEIAGESTIRILRPGGITAERLAEAAPGAFIDTPDAAGAAPGEEAPRSPGMKYTHYAPRGELVLVYGEPESVAAYIREQTEKAKRKGEAALALAFEEHAHRYDADAVLAYGSIRELETAAHGLYAALRECDDRGIRRIWAESCGEEGIGLALMNRLHKAAGGRIVYL